MGLTRKELAENICSEKYIYLIEKNQRSPSIETARLFSDKLRIDLFKYYYYLDCKDPVSVCESIEIFNKCRRTLDFESMNKATQEAELTHDFQNEPWSYEIFINKLMVDIFEKLKYRESIDCINDSLSKIHHKYSESIYIANLNVLLSICYQHIGEFNHANDAIMVAHETIQKKQRSPHYEQLSIAVDINMMIMAYHKKDYDKVIEMALFNESNPFKMNGYELSQFVFFLMAFAYYEKGLLEKAVIYFEKGLCASLICNKKIDMYYISKFKAFDVLMGDSHISQGLVGKYKEEYNKFL